MTMITVNKKRPCQLELVGVQVEMNLLICDIWDNIENAALCVARVGVKNI